MKNIKEISKTIKFLKTDNEVYQFLNELLTESELNTLSKRWRILKMLDEGIVQREIAKELNVSLCKITRGAKVLKNDKTIVKRIFKRDK